MVCLIVFRAIWSNFISAIILVIWHWVICSDVAPEPVLSLDSDVQKGFGILKEICAKDVPSIMTPSESLELTICVLCNSGYTL